MTDYEALYNQFTQSDKSLLIAPAGYGKTHTIAACLKHVYGTDPKERALILTHTHAGVASIKEKVKRVAPDIKCQIETITSFAQRYVHAFCRNEIPEQDNARYFPFLIEKAAILFRRSPITLVLKSSYTRLFVDEYQDCTVSQHKMVLSLASLLPTHVLGDPLQGIFSFNGEELVDFENDLREFEGFELNEPWRWAKTNPELGMALKRIRTNLLDCIPNNMVGLPAFDFRREEATEIYNPGSRYFTTISRIVNQENNLLIIHPSSENIAIRLKLIKSLNNRIKLVEAIDTKVFYEYARAFDDCNRDSFFSLLYDISLNLFNKVVIKKWLSSTGLKGKRDENDKKIRDAINAKMIAFASTKNFLIVGEILELISKLPEIKCYRKELYRDLVKSLKSAQINSISVFDAMREIRNIKRRLGRKITGKCIGTTLLTKGLEFETVMVLDAHRFTDPKNLYVALTRASKRLIVFSERSVLGPYV